MSFWVIGSCLCAYFIFFSSKVKNKRRKKKISTRILSESGEYQIKYIKIKETVRRQERETRSRERERERKREKVESEKEPEITRLRVSSLGPYQNCEFELKRKANRVEKKTENISFCKRHNIQINTNHMPWQTDKIEEDEKSNRL